MKLKLRNGAEEEDGLVNATMASLRHLANRDRVSLCELVALCRSESYEIALRSTAKMLTELGLIRENPAGRRRAGFSGSWRDPGAANESEARRRTPFIFELPDGVRNIAMSSLMPINDKRLVLHDPIVPDAGAQREGSGS